MSNPIDYDAKINLLEFSIKVDLSTLPEYAVSTWLSCSRSL